MKPLLITFAVFLSLYRPVYANDELTLAVLPYLPVKDIMQKIHAPGMVSVQDSDYDNLRKIMETIDYPHTH